MIEFFVPGIPVPQGSIRGFVVNGRAVLTSDNTKLKPWRNSVTALAVAAMRGHDRFENAVAVKYVFTMPRPKSVKRAEPTVKPDLDKLVRAINDALTQAGVWRDDSQVVESREEKRYETAGLAPGVDIEVREI